MLPLATGTLSKIRTGWGTAVGRKLCDILDDSLYGGIVASDDTCLYRFTGNAAEYVDPLTFIFTCSVAAFTETGKF